MFVKIGDIKLVNIRVIKDGNVVYEGIVEDAPEEIRETNYKSATFESNYIVVEI